MSDENGPINEPTRQEEPHRNPNLRPLGFEEVPRRPFRLPAPRRGDHGQTVFSRSFQPPPAQRARKAKVDAIYYRACGRATRGEIRRHFAALARGATAAERTARDAALRPHGAVRCSPRARHSRPRTRTRIVVRCATASTCGGADADPPPRPSGGAPPSFPRSSITLRERRAAR